MKEDEQMKAKESDWYKKIWTLDMKDMSWVEDTKREVDFLIQICNLQGGERILDLACGFGRHALEFAKRGYEVVGVDITSAYIEDARKSAADVGLHNVTFMKGDIRDVSFEHEFDLVLNLADGAIGYLENDTENLKIFDVVAKSLRPGGHHVCDIVNAEYADMHFPLKTWDSGSQSLSISEFDWNRETRIMLYGSLEMRYGERVKQPEIEEGDPTRLYTLEEIHKIMNERNMAVIEAFCDYKGNEASPLEFQMIIHSQHNS
jgi:SAM-dependent methyltransferase